MKIFRRPKLVHVLLTIVAGCLVALLLLPEYSLTESNYEDWVAQKHVTKEQDPSSVTQWLVRDGSPTGIWDLGSHPFRLRVDPAIETPSEYVITAYITLGRTVQVKRRGDFLNGVLTLDRPLGDMVTGTVFTSLYLVKVEKETCLLPSANVERFREVRVVSGRWEGLVFRRGKDIAYGQRGLWGRSYSSH